ncbi:hypothetical protein [Streptomyces sp. NPDC003374]
MAHPAQVTARPTRGTRTRPPNVLSDRTHRIARWAVPVVLGLLYGYWAAANRRAGGPITGWNILFGFVSAIVFALLMAGALRLGPRLKRETHAAMWFAFTGLTIGFLYSQTGQSVLLAVGISVALGVAVGLMCFYWFYTHEDAEGHRI